MPNGDQFFLMVRDGDQKLVVFWRISEICKTSLKRRYCLISVDQLMLCNLKPFSFYRRKRDVQPLRRPAIISMSDSDEECPEQSPRKTIRRSPLRLNTSTNILPQSLSTLNLSPVSSPSVVPVMQLASNSALSDVYNTPVKRKLDYITENTDINDTYINYDNEPEKQVYDTKKDCIDAMCKKYGSDMQRTLKVQRGGHGGRSEVYTCEECKDFRMNITYKTNKKQLASGWSVSERSSNLHHRTTTIENGKEVRYNCKGVYRAKLSDIKNIPQLQALVGSTKTHKSFTSVAKTLGVQVSKDIAKKALAKKLITGAEILASAAFIEPYLDELKERNPNCEVKLERYPGTDDFHRLLVIPSYTVDIVNKGYAYPVVGIDGAHMKDVEISKRIPRVLLEKMHVTVVSTRMPGNTLLILGFMLSHSECEADITELLRVLKEKGVDLDREDLVIISDRGNAIFAAVTNQFTKAYQHFCPIHIERNLMHHGYGKLLMWFWKARNATTKADHDIIMAKLRTKGSLGERMYTYLKTIPDHWQLYLLIEKGLTIYGMKSNNIIESVMSWILKERARSPYYFVKTMMHHILEALYEQKVKALARVDALTEHANKVYLENKRLLLCYAFEVTSDSDSTYHVVNTVDDSITAPDYSVNWLTRTCSCLQWQQLGVPCCHAIAVGEHLAVASTDFFAAPYFDKRMLQGTRTDAFTTCSFDTKLPTHDEVRNRLASHNYRPLAYRVRPGHLLPISRVRYASQGESLHRGNRDPRRNVVHRCRFCYQRIKSVRNHSVVKCTKTVVQLKERGEYQGPLVE